MENAKQSIYISRYFYFIPHVKTSIFGLEKSDKEQALTLKPKIDNKLSYV